MQPDGRSTRVARSVSADVDKLLGPKTLEQLIALEGQVKKKLDSNEDIDVEYWEQLLDNITVFKARAQLKDIYKSVIDSRLQSLKEQQVSEALVIQEKLAALYDDPAGVLPTVAYSRKLDPESSLKVKTDDKGLEIVPESEFLEKIVSSTFHSCVYHELIFSIVFGPSEDTENALCPYASAKTREDINLFYAKDARCHVNGSWRPLR